MTDRFELHAPYPPAGDQPRAIQQLLDNVANGVNEQILMGVTGSGKTFTMANVMAQLNRPALVLAHNKTLAAQLCAEFRSFFPHHAVEYFISYYDYYRPEAYLPSRDVYIEKEAQTNQEIERLRHAATRSLLTRRDVIIVASVSCIYGLGLPEEYLKGVIHLRVGERYSRRQLLLQLEQVQYERNDVELVPGTYRIKGDTMDVYPSWAEHLIRLVFFGDELESIQQVDVMNGHEWGRQSDTAIFPATHYVVLNQLDGPMAAIRRELDDRVKELMAQGKEFEARRLSQRTLYDLEMMAEIGYCKGIENYAWHLSNRPKGAPPGVLLDFFPPDFITFVDESHVTMPQVKGMSAGDRARKQTLIDFGFRLPSAIDNRPLTLDEFESKIGQLVYVSATPGPYELSRCRRMDAPARPDHAPIEWSDYWLTEQIIRPTGLLDPEVIIRPTLYQIDTLMQDLHDVINRGERALITTLTKSMAEELSQYLDDKGIKGCYLHSDIQSLERIDILHHLRSGKFDVLVGVNLLREGLDLPEVSLVAIMDADKEGFLRNERSLIQTIGRAARNANGRVVLYADRITDSMARAIAETNRRRGLQMAHNTQHGITPMTIRKETPDIRSHDRVTQSPARQLAQSTSPVDLLRVMTQLKHDMQQAAQALDFELAAVLRDQLAALTEQEGLPPDGGARETGKRSSSSRGELAQRDGGKGG
ncbi:excinuclease ABC subunit UvrB [bacterium]|nr:excinuclease ABC subunit UvrB [bacterium]